MTLLHRFDSEIPPVRRLRLRVEINTREHFSVYDYFKGRSGASQHPQLGQEDEEDSRTRKAIRSSGTASGG